jgi:GAF domain-containing protein
VSDSGELREGLAVLSSLIVGDQTLPETLRQVADIAVRAVYGTDGAGVAWVVERRPSTLTATADFVHLIDEAQYRLNEGPCLEACDRQRVVVVDSLTDDRRWPRFTPVAVRRGVCGVLSVPLTVRGAGVGAINLYSRSSGAFDANSAATAVLLAKQAAVALTSAHAFASAQATVDQLRQALISRAVIDQALGILMARERCSADRAFSMLREMSQHRNVRLRLIAQEVVDSITAEPDPDTSPDRD